MYLAALSIFPSLYYILVLCLLSERTSASTSCSRRHSATSYKITVVAVISWRFTGSLWVCLLCDKRPFRFHSTLHGKCKKRNIFRKNRSEDDVLLHRRSLCLCVSILLWRQHFYFFFRPSGNRKRNKKRTKKLLTFFVTTIYHTFQFTARESGAAHHQEVESKRVPSTTKNESTRYFYFYSIQTV